MISERTNHPTPSRATPDKENSNPGSDLHEDRLTG
jgi:hypothetical protein